MKFKIYYDDGSTYTDQDGPIELAPKVGVICIAQEDAFAGRKIDRSCDYYVMHDYGMRGVDQFGLYDYLTQPGSKIVLFGRTVSDERWREIWDEAANRDTYLPLKSAMTDDERRLKPE